MTTPDADTGRLAFIPLEANPELMTALLRDLGLQPGLAVHDVYSLSDPELLAFLPRPAHALLLVFPVSAAYESARLAEDATLPDYAGSGPDEPVVWFRQTIRNACGMMGLLHAVANGPTKRKIAPDSALDKFLKGALPLDPTARSQLIEKSHVLARVHHAAASQGDTAAPQATDDVDLHYVCFAKGDDGKTLWELDGRRKGPLARGTLDADEDVLSDKALTLGPRRFIEAGGGDIRFTAVVLAESEEIWRAPVVGGDELGRGVLGRAA